MVACVGVVAVNADADVDVDDGDDAVVLDDGYAGFDFVVVGDG